MAGSFSEAIAAPDDRINLAEAALWIARDAYPDLDIPGYLARLDAFAAAAAFNPTGQDVTTDRSRRADRLLPALNKLLFQHLGFHGARDNYYDPRNSYLNEVLERRTGIPITLALVYMEVGWRLGLPLVGVGLPGHFVVRWMGGGASIFVDVFDEGRILSVPDCERRVQAMIGQAIPLKPEWLQPVSRRAILSRILQNLKNASLQLELFDQAAAAVEKLLILEPGAADEMRDLGVIHARAGRRWAALTHLEQYLAAHPDAPDAFQVRQLTEALFAGLSTEQEMGDEG